MNKQTIALTALQRGRHVLFRPTSAGVEAAIKIGSGPRFVIALIPIDDESDERFANYLVGKTQEYERVQ